MSNVINMHEEIDEAFVAHLIDENRRLKLVLKLIQATAQGWLELTDEPKESA